MSTWNIITITAPEGTVLDTDALSRDEEEYTLGFVDEPFETAHDFHTVLRPDPACGGGAVLIEVPRR